MLDAKYNWMNIVRLGKFCLHDSKVLCQPLEESSYRFVWSSPCVREGPHTTQSGHLGSVTTTEAAGRGADQLDAPHSTHAPQHSVVPPYLLLRKLQPSPHTSHLTPYTCQLHWREKYSTLLYWTQWVLLISLISMVIKLVSCHFRSHLQIIVGALGMMFIE